MKTAIAIVVGLFLVIFSLSAYLSPDDLRRCEIATGPSTVAGCQRSDAIIVVSGGDTAARVDEGVRLYKAGWAPVLIFSGAARDKSGPSNAAAMRTYAEEQGVPEGDILIEEYGETTRQNAENTEQLFDNATTSIIVVTSPYHQRRAGLEFSKRFADTVTVRNHPAGSDNQWSAFWWLTPGGWYLAVSEFFKIIAFYLGGTR